MKSFSFNKVMAMAVCCLALAGNAFALSQNDSGVYQIGTCQDLVDFSNLVNSSSSGNYPNAGANAELTADIDMSCLSNTVKLYPIGRYAAANSFSTSSSNVYSGTFNGNGHIISNLQVERTQSVMESFNSDSKTTYYASLFGRVTGTVEDVIIYGLVIHTGSEQDVYDHVGGIVGYLDGGNVLGCTVAGSSVIEARRFVGGIVGRANGGVIKDCLSNVSLLGIAKGATGYVGGICGYAVNGTQIQSSVYVGTSIIRQCVHDDNCYCDNGSNNTNTCKYGNASYSGSHEYAITGGDNSISVDDCYYTNEINKDDETHAIEVHGDRFWCGDGASCEKGETNTTQDQSEGSVKTDDVNTADKVCMLNGGTWSNETCTGANDGPWSQSADITNHAGLHLGSDGTLHFDVTFDANGGAFPANATTTISVAYNENVSTFTSIDSPSRRVPRTTPRQSSPCSCRQPFRLPSLIRLNHFLCASLNDSKHESHISIKSSGLLSVATVCEMICFVSFPHTSHISFSILIFSFLRSFPEAPEESRRVTRETTSSCLHLFASLRASA